MKELRALIAIEAKLVFREPITWLAAIALPSVILLIFGSIFPPEPDPALGGLRFIDVFVPSLVVITLGTLGIQTLPIRLATYREKGVLRRLSTTPAHPARLLAAQLVIYMVTSVIALVLLVIVATVAFGVPLPAHPLGYVVAFLLGMTSLFAIGLLVAAVAPSNRAATAIAIPMFFAVMFLGGVYFPRVNLPDVLVRIGDFTPPGVQGLQDAWLGTAPQLAPLLGMAVVTVVSARSPSGRSGGSDTRRAPSGARAGVALRHEHDHEAGVGALRRRAGARCGYVLLAVATILGLLEGPADATCRLTTLAIAGVAAAWIYILFTRMPEPRRDDHVRMVVFFVGVLVLASILMLRQPAFFVFMISGFFYASYLRPLPLAVVGVGATSILVNSLIVRPAADARGVDLYLVIISVQTVVIGAGVYVGERMTEQNEERRQALARLEAATIENAGLHAQLLTQAREAGVLDERQRMAREIHDTIAQGLIGIVTQLEAADQARDRPADRDRHLENAERLARESLTEARRSVEASMPAALEVGTLPDAIADVAREWSEINAVPVAVAVTGEVVALHPEIEVALLRIAQEALANVARHAGAAHAWLTLSYMGDVVTLDVRDDGMGFRVDEPGSGEGPGSG